METIIENADEENIIVGRMQVIDHFLIVAGWWKQRAAAIEQPPFYNDTNRKECYLTAELYRQLASEIEVHTEHLMMQDSKPLLFNPRSSYLYP